MYYPIGWHKVLKLDISDGNSSEVPCKLLQVQANHERELFFILTSRSLHIWFPKPAAEIVCHRRSKESIDKIGLNRSAIWKTDSSVIVVFTECDQLLFYQIKKRTSSTSAKSFLLPASLNGVEGIYRLKHEPKNNKQMLNGQTPSDTSDSDRVPELTMFSFGKLDLSSIGVSCLMAAEEELVIGAKNGDMYGIQWDGNVDDKFPWSLSKEVQARGDYLIDVKFSSVLSGFAFVFKSGRIGFMPSKLNDLETSSANRLDTPNFDTNISYLPHVNDANHVEINHRHRLIAFGRENSQVIVCNIGENNISLVINHILELDSSKIPHNISKLGPIKAMSYSPNSAALAVSWEGGDFAIWSVFGSLLFCTQQWQLECDNNAPVKPVRVQSLAWGREGYNLWLCNQFESDTNDQHGDSIMTDSMSTSTSFVDVAQSTKSLEIDKQVPNKSNNFLINNGALIHEQVSIMPLAHCNLTSSPHFTCSSDSIVLMAEEKIFIGPSVPHEDKFDHWIVIDIAQCYLRSQHPIKYAIVDRNSDNLAIAGLRGIALYSIRTCKWRFLSKKGEVNSFSVCGDLIWWQNYLIASCFNYTSQSFEIRAYATSAYEERPHDELVIQPIALEIIRMSIFENRLLVLYVDGTLGMFMLNLKRRPPSLRGKRQANLLMRSNSIASANGRITSNGQLSNVQNNTSSKTNRSDSIISWNNLQSDSKKVVLQISPIENLIISNLQANAYCISSIALTRLHFKNNRQDDSILLNACGKLFLLEREAPPEYLPSSSTPVSSSGTSATTPENNNNMRDLSFDGNYSNIAGQATITNSDEAIKVNSPKTLANSVHLASASLRTTSSLSNETSALSNVTFKAVSVIATNVEQFWISPEISTASEMSYFRRSLWLLCGNSMNLPNSLAHRTIANSPNKLAVEQQQNNGRHLQVWLPLLNDKIDPPNDLYVPDRIMLPIRCDIYPLAIRSSSTNYNFADQNSIDKQQQQQDHQSSPDDAIVLGAESDVLYKDCKLFTHFPYTAVKRQCRVYLHRVLRELLLSQHLGYYAKKIAESCQSLPYFAHCFELLLHEVLEEEATSPIPLPDPMLPQVVRFIKQFPKVYLETVVHCARKSELSMWSHLFDERAVGNPRRLFQECLEKQKLDTAASCLIILQSLDRNIVSSPMFKELMRLVKENKKFDYLLEDLESFLLRAELDSNRNKSESPN